MAFTTKLDFSSNRQVKQHEKTITSLSGGTSFGLTFTAMTSGVDSTTSGVTQTITSITGTFSGNSGTTNYSWYDSRMSLGESALSAITPSISGITQITGPVFTSDTTTIIDNNNVVLSYSGVDYNVTVTAMDDLGGGSYSGTISTAILNILSANTLDYTGRTIWNDVYGITRTERLIITESPNVGYVWTCNNVEGMGEWAPSSGSPTTSIWTGGTGTYSAVLAGSGGIASNTNSVSEGRNTQATGYASHAEGMGTIASGDYSHAEGLSDSFGTTIASGLASHAEGSSTRASGQASHAEGMGTIASGFSSHAGGAYSRVDSDYGFIHSDNSKIYLGSQYSAILGGFNNIINTSQNSGVFVGGNNTITGTSTIFYSAIIGGSSNTIEDNSNYSVIIGGSNNSITNSANYSVVLGGQNIVANTGYMVYVPDLTIDGLTSTDPIATDSNGKIVAGTSDARLKQNINELNNSLDIIKNLRGVSFEYTPESEMGSGIRYGFIAQEVQEFVPDIVRNRAKGNGMLSLNYNEIVPILVEAVKELSSGVTTSNNTYLETQTILAEDNNIDLNYSGTPESAVGGGIRVLHALGVDSSAELITDSEGNFITNNDFKPNTLTIPLYTPTSSTDVYGSEGNITRDDNYLYIKGSAGWKRTNLESF